MQPRQRLTAREAEVATPVWQGVTNRDIAALIGTTEQVVKNYLRD
ncbi:MAG TPA: LuxR C-terminal-related transcriptional regulator [Terriglobales bacterium]|nr:LuxR C-terminal-related transcriptional regulator [Terriglobales bacterium]